MRRRWFCCLLLFCVVVVLVVHSVSSPRVLPRLGSSTKGPADRPESSEGTDEEEDEGEGLGGGRAVDDEKEEGEEEDENLSTLRGAPSQNALAAARRGASPPPCSQGSGLNRQIS